MTKWDLIVVGGGAAGYFGAIQAAAVNNSLRVLILEKGKRVLEKVRISGGGRCNVTHACYDPKELTNHYPRGNRELLGPFYQFGPSDTIQWFEERKVPLKTEADGRIFPVSDDSQSIVSCLQKAQEKLGIELKLGSRVTHIEKENDKGWLIRTDYEQFTTRQLFIATGSNPNIYKLLSQLGLPIVSPVPSLFTFNCKDDRIKGLPGISVDRAEVKIIIKGKKGTLVEEGPLLITHWGFSGPAVLKLSAWGARLLKEANYQFTLKINWLGIAVEEANSLIDQYDKKGRLNRSPFRIPQRLWMQLLKYLGFPPTSNWGDLSKKNINALVNELTGGDYQINGKSTFKEEFVTAGGVELKAVDFKSFQAKNFPGLFLAGEVLNIDGVTGGFNFQAAWTGGWLAGNAIGALK